MQPGCSQDAGSNCVARLFYGFFRRGALRCSEPSYLLTKNEDLCKWPVFYVKWPM
jgi:hypothetical protein